MIFSVERWFCGVLVDGNISQPLKTLTIGDNESMATWAP